MATRSTQLALWTGLVGLSAATVLAPAAWAQDKSGVLISSDAAKSTLNKYEISVDAAEKIVKTCIAYAKSKNAQVAVFVLGPSGNVVYAYRMDGLNPINVDTAWRKAQTVLYARTSTHAMENRYGPGMRPTFYELGQFPHSGAIPIMLDGQLIGSVGVGGNRAEDERCGYEGVVAVVGPQPPLAVDPPREEAPQARPQR
jgi:glc operon protein GlcG